VLAEDETHVNLLPWVRATWVVYRHPPAGHDPRHQSAADDLRRGGAAQRPVSLPGLPQGGHAAFTGFCEQLLAAYPTAPMVVAVVCHNVIIHHSRIVQAWLAAHPRVRVRHGARHSPH
jgi:hypothetical protein